MRRRKIKQFLALLMACVMIFGGLPAITITVHAGHGCPECQEWIDGSPYCDECYKCDSCIDLCLECGKCTDCLGVEICDGCSDEESGKICMDCAIEKGQHCPGCDTCYFQVFTWCEECGMCEDCIPYDGECSVTHGMHLCIDCAIEMGSHCQGCGTCYFEAGTWCEECGLCEDCSPYDEGCSNTVGAVICKECATYHGNHCPVCDQCYFDIGGWCEECGQCDDCSSACLYCCEEAGEVICTECAIDQGMHCPDCSECYGESGGELCIECGICGNCADICSNHEMCIDCTISEGYHCPTCETCGDDAAICEDCGEYCIDCANEFCESCNLCGECILICQDCGSCESCATICPGCEEYCSECEGICDDCGLCLVCCSDLAFFAGCDCSEWMCIESTDWDQHFIEEHTGEQISSHTARPSAAWTWDDTYHWHECTYCNETSHITNKSKHTYNVNEKCTVCSFVKDAKIQIIVQPKDSKNVLVMSAEEEHDESNIAHFAVKALGNSELTYTWYEGYYSHSLGRIKYIPIEREPEEGECFEGPELSVLVSTDACIQDWYICCVIMDEAGNEVKTRDTLVQAKHNYQYYRHYKTNKNPYELVQRSRYGHILQCVGEGCEKVTHLLPHEDGDQNGYCDICNFEVGRILIKKQPKNVKNVYVYGPDEDYDESNIAHFSVEAVGEGKLTYTWCRRQYVSGQLTYVPLDYPQQGENYTGPNLDLLVPMDACCNTYVYCCFITDEAGNEIKTVDVTLEAKHNYQYYKQYRSHENPYPDARKRYAGHILVCVGDDCGKVTRMRQHLDEDRDYVCDICDFKKNMYDPVGIYVTLPKEGQLPNYVVDVDRPACYLAMGGSSNYTQYRFWFVSDNGVDNWKLIDKNTPFVAGKYYKFIVEMKTKDGYEFWDMVSYDGEEPYIWATVNGNYTKAHKTYGMDPNHYISIHYEFGMCNDSEIESIVIDNVTEPIAGNKPTYTATIRGSGYYIDTNKNESYDAYWKNPPEEWPYIVNGIGWYDVTKDDWVYSHEYFITGHEYRIKIFLKTEEGYEFKVDKYLESQFTASINSFVAIGNGSIGDGAIEQSVCTTFTCQGKKISTVMVNSLDTPKAGKSPDYSPVMAYPEWYQLDPNYAGTGGVIWYDSQGNQLEPTDTFVEGERYKVEIKLISAKLDGANTSQFVSPVIAYVNGKQVVQNSDWDGVYAGSNAVYIYYTFTKGAEPPEKTKEYLVSYIKGEGTGTMGAAIVEDDEMYTLEECTFIPPSGYKFKAWAIGDENGKQKNPGEQIKITKDTYIYAVWEQVIDTHICVLTLVASVEGTCIETGKRAYYKCNGCGKCYEDALGQRVISDFESWGELSAGHKFGSDDICDICGYSKSPLTLGEKEAKDKLGLTDGGAKEIIDFVEKNNLHSTIIYVTDKTITSQKSEDVKEATYSILSARATKTTKNKIVVKWNKVPGADGYIVYGNKCGTKKKYKKLKTFDASKLTYSQSKCKKGTYYKYLIIAYKLVDGKKITIAASKTVHAVTKGGKYGNAKDVKVNKAKIKIKRKKSFTLKASEIKNDKKINIHRKIAFESSNSAIATVNSKGKIVGKKKGKCFIYVYAQNGVCKKIKVRVK